MPEDELTPEQAEEVQRRLAQEVIYGRGTGQLLGLLDAPAVPPGGKDELREALARAFAPKHWPILLERHRDRLRARADAVLALPELAALIADAERVRRVREFLDRRIRGQRCISTAALRRALDGDQ